MGAGELPPPTPTGLLTLVDTAAAAAAADAATASALGWLADSVELASDALKVASHAAIVATAVSTLRMPCNPNHGEPACVCMYG